MLTPGMKGVLITCNEREKLCVKEAYNVLNEVRFYFAFLYLHTLHDLFVYNNNNNNNNNNDDNNNNNNK